MKKSEILRANEDALFEACKRADILAWTKEPTAVIFSIADEIITLPKVEADNYPHEILFRADYHAKPERMYPSEEEYRKGIDVVVYAFLRDDVNDAIHEAMVEERRGRPIIHDCGTCEHNLHTCCAISYCNAVFRTKEMGRLPTFRCRDYREKERLSLPADKNI